MTEFELKLNLAEKYFSTKIEESYLFNILFEMNRYFDKQFVLLLHTTKNTSSRLNQNERNLLRKYYYYGISDWLSILNISNFPKYSATENDKLNVLNSFIERCNIYDKEKIISSVEERYNLLKEKKVLDNSAKWLNWFNEKRKTNSKYSLFVYDFEQADFEKCNFEVNNILKTIAEIYDELENYRYFVFKLHGKLFNLNKEDVTWKVLYKIGIYSENFISYTKPFFPFKKQKEIEKLTTFLDERFTDNDNKSLSENFYNAISTGFKFEDCFISDNQDDILLSFKKIKMDPSEIPCPSCMTTIQSGNSFPEIFLRSYECKNPTCPERSKSGRGKRFDEFGVYRYFKLTENKSENKISEELFSRWRRDIFSSKNDIYEMLVNYYAWDNETICISKNVEIKNTNKRKIIFYENSKQDVAYNTEFEKIPIVVLFSKINDLIPSQSGNRKLSKNLEILNENSTENISMFAENQIGTAMTSPPYYNAREYSWWSNTILYLIDMMRNAKAVYNVLCDDGYYLYNIGDIVDADNIYVESNMSKKRLQLGFLSCLIFEKVGFNLVGNIIWDKGEVQSKRNSTMNHNSGYVKCINCYEHVFVFKKGTESKIVSNVKRITPVIKINSKGENTYKHTAPYPLDLVELLRPFVKTNKYILDPFLGSGTTLKWCKKNHFKGIGFEMNKEYFELAKKYIEETKEQLSLFD
jgi:DNA modification methylase